MRRLVPKIFAFRTNDLGEVAEYRPFKDRGLYRAVHEETAKLDGDGTFGASTMGELACAINRGYSAFMRSRSDGSTKLVQNDQIEIEEPCLN